MGDDFEKERNLMSEKMMFKKIQKTKAGAHGRGSHRSDTTSSQKVWRMDSNLWRYKSATWFDLLKN